MNKNEEGDFDVSMGCHELAEIWELVSTFILNKISPIMEEQNNVGLYRDDDLSSEICRDATLKKIKRRSLSI